MEVLSSSMDQTTLDTSDIRRETINLEIDRPNGNNEQAGKYRSGMSNDDNKSQENQKNNDSINGIMIAVTDPLVKGDKSMMSFVAYTIKGIDKDGPFETFRRYSEFSALRNVMIHSWPGCYIPPLPPKQTVGNKNVAFLEERKRFLDKFCKGISEMPHLYYSEEFQIFLRSNNPDIEKALSNLAKPTIEDIISKYSVAFSHLSGRELNADVVMKITKFYNFLKDAQIIFKSFKSISKAMAQAKKAYHDQISHFHDSCLLKYEKLCLAEYSGNHQGKFVLNHQNNQKIHDFLNKLRSNENKDSLEFIYEFMKSESYEIDAFLEALATRDKYEHLRAKAIERQKSETNQLQRIISGKTTLKTLLSRKSREEEISLLEKQVIKTIREVDNLLMIHDMMTIILAFHEIDFFKTKKLDKYHEVMKECSKLETLNSHHLVEYWSAILENVNSAFEVNERHKQQNEEYQSRASI